MRIIYQDTSGNVSQVIPSPRYTGSMEELAKKTVPVNCEYKIVENAEIPGDRTFRDAWELENGSISISLNKAKDISHDKRRIARSEEFKPLDIRATIPHESEQAELDRQSIRDKYAVMQNDIDLSNDINTLKNIITDIL